MERLKWSSEDYFFVKIGVVYENPLQYSYLDNLMDRGAR